MRSIFLNRERGRVSDDSKVIKKVEGFLKGKNYFFFNIRSKNETTYKKWI